MSAQYYVTVCPETLVHGVETAQKNAEHGCAVAQIRQTHLLTQRCQERSGGAHRRTLVVEVVYYNINTHLCLYYYYSLVFSSRCSPLSVLEVHRSTGLSLVLEVVCARVCVVVHCSMKGSLRYHHGMEPSQPQNYILRCRATVFIETVIEPGFTHRIHDP